MASGDLKGAQVVKIRACSEHNGMSLNLVCSTCKDKLVCSKCVNTSHKKHTFTNIDQFVSQKKDAVTEKLKLVHKHEDHLPSLMKEISRLKFTNKEQTEKAIDKIRQRKQEFQTCLDKLVDDLEEKCRQKEQSTDAMLSKQEETIGDLQQNITKYTVRCHDALNSSSSSQIVHLSIDELDTFPGQCDLTLQDIDNVVFDTAIFHINDTNLAPYFGKLSIVEVAKTDDKSKTNSKGTPLFSPPRPKLLPRLRRDKVHSVKEVARFYIASAGIYAICPVSEDQAWIASFAYGRILSKTPTLFSTKGEAICHIPFDVQVKDLVQGSDGSPIVSCKGGTVRELISATVSFTTKQSQSGLCVDQEGNVVICFCDAGLLIKYSKSGSVLSLMSSNESGISHPYKISSNPKTGGFVVTDKGVPSSVFLLDTNLKVQYIYNGLTTYRPGIDTSPQQPPASEQKQFNEACFDLSGDVIVSGIDNISGFLIKLDCKGNFLSRLQSFGRIGPYCLSCGSDGKLWVGLENGNIVLFQ